MFDTWYEFKDEKVILTKPLKVEPDYLKLKEVAVRYLCALREHYSDELVITYSGGLDSAFVLRTFKECVDRELLPQDAYRIISADFYENFYEEPDDLKRWFADTYIKLPIELFTC